MQKDISFHLALINMHKEAVGGLHQLGLCGFQLALRYLTLLVGLGAHVRSLPSSPLLPSLVLKKVKIGNA